MPIMDNNDTTFTVATTVLHVTCGVSNPFLFILGINQFSLCNKRKVNSHFFGIFVLILKRTIKIWYLLSMEHNTEKYFQD